MFSRGKIAVRGSGDTTPEAGTPTRSQQGGGGGSRWTNERRQGGSQRLVEALFIFLDQQIDFFALSSSKFLVILF